MNMNRKLVVAVYGEAGSGKDYLVREAMDTEDIINTITSYTTRPMRDYEVEGYPYHFVSENTFRSFVEEDKMIEYGNFRDWLYGTPEFELKDDKVNLGVFNINGVRQLMKRDDLEVLPVYVYATAKTRLIRQLNREQSPDVEEIIRRYSSDKEDFDLLIDNSCVLYNDFLDEDSSPYELDEIICDFYRNKA